MSQLTESAIDLHMTRASRIQNASETVQNATMRVGVLDKTHLQLKKTGKK